MSNEEQIGRALGQQYTQAAIDEALGSANVSIESSRQGAFAPISNRKWWFTGTSGSPRDSVRPQPLLEADARIYVSSLRSPPNTSGAGPGGSSDGSAVAARNAAAFFSMGGDAQNETLRYAEQAYFSATGINFRGEGLPEGVDPEDFLGPIVRPPPTYSEDLYDSAQVRGILSASQLEEQIRSSWRETLVALGVSDIPDEVAVQLEAFGTGDDIFGGPAISQQQAWDLYKSQVIWDYYTRILIDGNYSIEPDLTAAGMLDTLAQIYKNSKVHDAADVTFMEAAAEVASEAAEAILTAPIGPTGLPALGGTAADPLDLLGRVEEKQSETDQEMRDRTEEELREEGARQEDRDPAQEAQQRRLSEQAFLIDFMSEYAALNQKRNPDYLNDDGVPHFLMVHGQTDTIVNQLIYNPQLEAFNRIKPSEMAGLVPKIKLYKAAFEQASNGLR